MKTRYSLPRILRASSVVCVLTVAGSNWLHAQTAKPAGKSEDERIALQEFVVSETADSKGYAATSTGAATRTNTALIDTPTVVNVVTRAFLEDTQASELYDALKYVPGVSLESNVGDSVMMRGYTVRSQFTDGLYDNQNQSQLGAEPYQYERVEVLKGPSAMVYGSTALGGLVNRVRKTAKFKAAGQWGVTVGSFGQHKLEFDYTAPLTEKLAYRVVAVYKDDGDSVRGVDTIYGFARRWNLNPSIVWQPSETTKVKVIGEFMHEKYYKDWGSTAMYSNGAYDPNSTAVGTFLSYPFGTVLTYGKTYEQGGNSTFGVLPRNFTFGASDAYARNAKQYGSIVMETQITPEWSLRNSAQAHWWDHFALDYIPNGMARNNHEMIRLWRPIANDDFTATYAIDSVYNFHIASSEHKVLSILQTEYQSNAYPIWGVAPGTPNIPNLDIYNPVRTVFTPTATVLTQNTYTNNYSFGWAIQDHAKFLGDKLQAVVGTRYDWFGSQAKNFLLVSNQNGNRNAGQQWTYKYGVIVKPTRAYSLFYNHSETYNPNFGVQPDGTSFDNQSGVIDEVGAKSALFDGRLAGSVSVYELKLSNIVSNDPDPVRSAAGWKVLTAYQRVKGYEVDLFATVTKNWQVNVGCGILDMKLPPGTGQAALAGSKLQPRGLPEQTYNAWTRYDIRNGALKGVAFGGGWTYRTKSPIDATNMAFREGANVLDAFVQYGWRKYRFALNVSNLTDEYYIGTTVNPPQMFAAPMRQFKFRVSQNF